MLPVLFSIGPISISSFGFFLAVGFLYGTYLIWRQARAWDLDGEKVLDLTLLTFFGGLLGSRIYFALEHWEFFVNDLVKTVLITKYPGFSFWGAFLGGWLTLFIFARRLSLNFWQIADIAAVGFLGGLIMGSIGCFLGGCGAGITTNFLGVEMVGLIGKRFPVQALEALIFILVLSKIWPKALRFHTPGKIASLALIYIGLTKFILEFLREQQRGGILLSLALVVLGVTIFYQVSKRNIKDDLKHFLDLTIKLITEKEARQMVLHNRSKSWYNLKVSWSWRLRNLSKLLRRFHVRTSPKEFK